MRRTTSRLAQLRRHLNRCKWRDKQAEQTYWTLVLAQKPRSYVNLSVCDEILKAYYTDAAITQAFACNNSLFAELAKKSRQTLYCVVDKEASDDRAYVLPVSGLEAFLPETNMVKARCPDCDELIEITPNGKDPATTNRRQRLVVHPDKARTGKLCDGSGKDV